MRVGSGLFVTMLLVLGLMVLPNNVICVETYSLTPVSDPYIVVHPILRIHGIYKAILNGYSISDIYVWNNTLWVITNDRALYKSTDLVNYELVNDDVIGSYIEYDGLSPIGKDILFITGNGTMLVALYNSTMFAIFKSNDYGISFVPVLVVDKPFDVWDWVETTNGTIFFAQYGGASENLGLVYRSDDYGSTWSIVLNMTALTGESTKHLHGLVYDSETNRLYAIGGEPSWNLAWSDDYGNTWKVLKISACQGIVYDDYLVFGSDTASGLFYHFFNKTDMTMLKRIMVNATYHGPGAQFTIDIVKINEVIYSITFGYNESLRILNSNGVADLISIRDPSINQGWSKIANNDINDKIVALYITNGVNKLIVFDALTPEEADFLIGQDRYVAGYEGVKRLSIYGYVKDLTITFEPYSIIDTLLFYEDFEDGDVSDWSIVSGVPDVTNYAFSGSYALKVDSGDFFEKTVTGLSVPVGSVIVGVMAIDIDASAQTGFSAYLDIKFGLSDGSVVTKYLAGYTVPRCNTSGYKVFWSSYTFDKEVVNMTIKIRTYGTGVAYLDSIAFYTVDQSNAFLYNNNPIITTFPVNPNYTVIINNVTYTGNMITLTLNRYVDVLNVEVPRDQVFKIEIGITGAYANVPLVPFDKVYYYRYGGDENEIYITESDRMVVLPKTDGLEITSIDLTDRRLYLELNAANINSTTIIYTVDKGEPQYIKRLDISEILKKVSSLSDLENTTDAWFYNSTSRLLYVKVEHLSLVPVDVSWEPLTSTTTTTTTTPPPEAPEKPWTTYIAIIVTVLLVMALLYMSMKAARHVIYEERRYVKKKT